MGSFSIWHWLVVLVIVILIFGTKKLKTLGSDLGEAIKNFKRGMKDEEGKPDAAPAETAPAKAEAAPVRSEAAPVAEPRRLAHQPPTAPTTATPVRRKARVKARAPVKAKAKAKSKARRATRTKSGST